MNSALFTQKYPGLDDKLNAHPTQAGLAVGKDAAWEGGCSVPQGKVQSSGTVGWVGGLTERERRRWIQGCGYFTITGYFRAGETEESQVARVFM